MDNVWLVMDSAPFEGVNPDNITACSTREFAEICVAERHKAYANAQVYGPYDLVGS